MKIKKQKKLKKFIKRLKIVAKLGITYRQYKKLVKARVIKP